MLISLLPLVSLAMSHALADGGASDELGMTTPRAAQVRLAETLAEADAIYAVSRTGNTITFAVDHDGDALDVAALVDARGQVIEYAIDRIGPARGEPSGLGWLSAELTDALAITRLAVARDGSITATTDDDRSYRLIRTRGANTGVDSRWAAAWDGPS
ncbi:MAG: hypothetical protein SFX73_14115 [Kofleriaceae bacterium]|nr:hypothetical protein [Kofleriaceae bacterium]